jgi:uncharacterized membrane protein HdeD (DUF308 family)
MPDTKTTPASASRRGVRIPVELCGGAIVVLGGLAFLVPLMAPDLASAAFAGVLLAAAGLGAFTLKPGHRMQLLWRALWIAVACLTGLAVLYHHWSGRPSLSWAVGLGAAALALVAAGQLLQAGDHRRLAWGGLTVGVLFTLALGAVLVLSGPHAGVMILALFIAGNLIVFGLSLIVTGLVGRAGATFL